MDDLSATRETYARVADEYAEATSDRAPIRETLRSFRDRLDGPRVLDVGCGAGHDVETLAEWGCVVVGLDVMAEFVRQARERSDAPAVRGDMRRLPFVANAVDGVWACASFLHVPRSEAPATLAEFARVLAPGGALHLSVKRGSGVRDGPTYDRYDRDRRRFTLWERDELLALVADAGMTVASVGTDDRWLWLDATT